MLRSLRPLLLAVVVAAVGAPVVAHAGTAAAAAEPSAEDIVQRAMSKGAVGFRQGTASLQMTITTAKGETRPRSLEIRAMRGADGLLRSMVRFQTPADVNGTSYLVVEKKDALPDQWVYVPKAKVVRRIAAGNASSSFFGSDFTFADLMPLPMSEKDKVSINKLPDGDVGGQAVYVLEVVPKIEGAPYGKLIAHISKTLLVPLKIEFFDTNKAPLKTLRVKKLQKVNDEQIPVEIEMKSESGAKTELVLEKVDPNAKLTEADFTEEAMQR